MVDRRKFLKFGLAGASTAALARSGEQRDTRAFLCPPNGLPDQLRAEHSPPAEPFKAELFVPPVMQPVAALNPPPNPKAHQLYHQFPPKKLYEIHQNEFPWVYHPDPPYNVGSLGWGFDKMTPGPVFHAYYGEPILVRQHNDLPPVGVSKVTWALPSTSIHLHNAHTASESDGEPQDWIDSGEFWDHHYPNFPSGHDPREKLATLWYHDHRLDFTAANVYAGLSGFYMLFDEQDSNNENDPNPAAWRLPSGKYDVPLILHDVMFFPDMDGPRAGQVNFSNFYTAGWLGDQVTVNRRIRPRFTVEARKYRFRIINGGPSRFYRLKLSDGSPFTVLTGDGNFLPRPLRAERIYLSTAQRVDIILDFSKYKPGTQLILQNDLEQFDGQGPSGRTLSPPDGILRFDVVAATAPDPSRVPDKFRDLPRVDLGEVRFKREWVFDYDGGLWTINGMVMDPNRIDAGVEQDSAEIWTLRNGGNIWSHPVHIHFTEFLVLEVNGVPVYDRYQSSDHQQHTFLSDDKVIPIFMGGPRRDVATLLPNDEVVIFLRFKDFLGKYVMHCHNVVHEDHAMMVRWDIVEPGQGFLGSRSEQQVYGTPEPKPHLEERPESATSQQ